MQKQQPEVFCKKKVFLEISQNSQENTCASLFFNKVILFLLGASDITNTLIILTKSWCQLVCVKPWLQRRSTKSACPNIISELKLQDSYDSQKNFVWIVKLIF